MKNDRWSAYGLPVLLFSTGFLDYAWSGGETVKQWGNLLLFLGVLVLIGAVWIQAENKQEDQRAQHASYLALRALETATEGLTETVEPAEQMPVRKADGEDYVGILSISALGLELPVMDEWSYPKLKKVPCRYAGSILTGDLILMAHNYESHFGNLKRLELGDEVLFEDMAGDSFSYQVTAVEALGSGDRAELWAGEWDLTLFTCTPGGASRVVVRCIRWEETAPT